MYSKKLNRIVLIAIFGFVFLLISVGVGVIIIKRETTTQVGAANPSIILTTNNTSPKVNTSFVIAATINTQGAIVNGLDLKVKYDTNLLTATGITVGPFLPYVFVPGTISNGVANIVLGPSIDTAGPHPVSGTGVVAQIQFKAKATGTSNVTVDSTSKVSVSGQTTNMLGVSTPVQITVLAAGTPTPLPTKSPSPVPTRSPSPIPTRSPSPAPSASPGLATYTISQVATHNTTTNCWLIMNNNVYNVTNFLSIHPGGVNIIASRCGTDATQAFASIGHSNTAKNLLTQYLIGVISSANPPTPTVTPTRSPSPLPTTPPQIPGDVDGNGVVNIVDIGIIIDNYSLTPLPDTRADLNHDGIANIVDIGIVIDYYGL